MILFEALLLKADAYTSSAEMQPSCSSFCSQDDSYQSECTPRDQDSYQQSYAMMNSPENRKKRGRFFAIFGKSNAENLEIEPSHFNMSQDDSNKFSSSQFSQDFTDRLGCLSMKTSQDHWYSHDSRSAFSGDGNSFPFGSNSNSSISNRNGKLNPMSTMKNPPPLSQSRLNSNREVPLYLSSSSKRTSSEALSSAANTIIQPSDSNRRQIAIAPAIENPFIKDESCSKNVKKSKMKRKSR